MQHQQLANHWRNASNYLACLSVDNETELINLIKLAQEKDIVLSIFREPDIEDQITAIALAPCTQSKKICRALTLSLKD
jgi:hypothetical protein